MEVIANLFHTRHAGTVIRVGGQKVKEQHNLEAMKNDPGSQEVIASLFHVKEER
jgi:hypothetical protein